MDRLKQKLKKEKQRKDCSKDKYPVFITDVKSMKENLKIKEILRTVKMNSSMRLKAPPGSKVMSNKDFNDEDFFEESSISVNTSEPLSATNPDVIVNKLDEEEGLEVINDDCVRETNSEIDNIDNNGIPEENNCQRDSTDNYSVELNNTESNQNNYRMVDIVDKSAYESNGRTNEKSRERKLSLDHTMLSRQDGFTQSELDLHTIGKSPLERKYSFFRKKMDSFVRNTTEMFRKQNSSLQRRMSMSVSLQSLNDKCSTSEINETPPSYQQEPLGSRTSLQTASPIARSTSSLSLAQSGILRSSSSQTSLAGSQPALSSPTFEDNHSSSVHSLNEDFITEAMLNSRAISMSSGLDTPYGQQRRKASRANRVTWIASEGLTNYLRRKIQDEKSKEMQTCHSYQDFSCIPENDLYSRKPDTKGRRLSYQRAVSGEDPMPIRYQDSTLRRRQQIPEYSEVNFEVANCLEEFTKNCVPPLAGFDVEPVPEEALVYLHWATKPANIEDVFDTTTLSQKEQALQAVVRELIHTEADYIKHLTVIVELFIAAAHDIQSKGKMLSIDTEKLFSNLPDLLNASIYFWNLTFVPMIKEAISKCEPFNTNMMSQGFACFKDVFMPYEKFVVNHSKLIEYYRKKQQIDTEFAMYISWCHKQKQCKRLQLNDLLVKPMQRMTKYSLILNRINDYTDSEPQHAALEIMENCTKRFVADVNRSVRQREEQDKLELLENSIEHFEVDVKDEEVERICKSFAKLNLKAPMLHCLSVHSRNIIHQGELRFRDGAKDIDARVMLLTDMLVICKKLARGLPYQYKQIRTKYMIDKMVQIPRFISKNNKDIASLLYVLVDDLGSACASFVLSEMPKDPNPQLTLKTWENKFKEAKLTYELSTLIAQNPNKELSQAVVDNAAEYTNTKSRFACEAGLIENAARERVATMSHRSMGATDRDFSQITLTTHSFEGTAYTPQNHIVTGASARLPGRYKKCTIVHRSTPVPNNITPPRDSHYSSDQQLPSARRLEEPQAGPSKPIKLDGSLDRLHPPSPQTEINGASITFNVSESDADITTIQQNTTELETPSSRSVTTLRVQPHDSGAAHIYSLPDLTIEPCTPRSNSSLTQPSASEKIYQIHQERLQRNRLMSTQTQQYLSPDTRGSSYPPPSPTRASLKRSLAFSYSIKNPPLSKMGHVNSQSQGHLDSVQHSQDDRSTSPKTSSSLEKSDKKSKLTSSRKKKRDVSEDRQSEPCYTKKHGSLSPSHKESRQPSRKAKSSCSNYKDESPGTSYRGGSVDFCFRDKSTSPSHRDESPGTSYKSESPEPSYREISPYASGHYESPVPSHKEGSFDRSSVEVSSTPGPINRSNDSLPRSGSHGVDDRNIKTYTKDEYRTSRESKSSDSNQKEKSLSLSFKDESYDSSHRDGSMSLSHKDEASSSDHKESPVCKDKKSELYLRQQSSSIESHDSSDEDSSDKERDQDIYEIFQDIECSSVICKADAGDTSDNNKISDPYQRLNSSSSSPSEDRGQSLREKHPQTFSKNEVPISKDEITKPSCSHDSTSSSPSSKQTYQGSLARFEYDDSSNTSSADEKCS